MDSPVCPPKGIRLMNKPQVALAYGALVKPGVKVVQWTRYVCILYPSYFPKLNTVVAVLLVAGPTGVNIYVFGICCVFVCENSLNSNPPMELLMTNCGRDSSLVSLTTQMNFDLVLEELEYFSNEMWPGEMMIQPSMIRLINADVIVSEPEDEGDTSVDWDILPPLFCSVCNLDTSVCRCMESECCDLSCPDCVAVRDYPSGTARFIPPADLFVPPADSVYIDGFGTASPFVRDWLSEPEQVRVFRRQVEEVPLLSNRIEDLPFLRWTPVRDESWYLGRYDSPEENQVSNDIPMGNEWEARYGTIRDAVLQPEQLYESGLTDAWYQTPFFLNDNNDYEPGGPEGPLDFGYSDEVMEEQQNFNPILWALQTAGRDMGDDYDTQSEAISDVEEDNPAEEIVFTIIPADYDVEAAQAWIDAIWPVLDEFCDVYDAYWGARLRLIYDIETNPGPSRCVYVGLASMDDVWDRSTFKNVIQNDVCRAFPFDFDETRVEYEFSGAPSLIWTLFWFFFTYQFKWQLFPFTVWVYERWFMYLWRRFRDRCRLLYRAGEYHILFKWQAMRGFGVYCLLGGVYVYWALFEIMNYWNPVNIYWISLVLYALCFLCIRLLQVPVHYAARFLWATDHHFNSYGPWQALWILCCDYIWNCNIQEVDEVPITQEAFDDRKIREACEEFIHEYFDNDIRHISTEWDSPVSMFKDHMSEQMDDAFVKGDAAGPLHPEWASFEHSQDRKRMLQIRKTLLKIVRRHEVPKVTSGMLRLCISSLNEYFRLHPKEEMRMSEQMFTQFKDFFTPKIGLDDSTKSAFLAAADKLSKPSLDIPMLTSIKDQIVLCYEKPEFHQFGLFLGYLALSMCHESGWSKALLVADGIHLYTSWTYGLTCPGSLAMGGTRVLFKLTEKEPVQHIRPKFFWSQEEWEEYEAQSGGDRMCEQMKEINWEDDDTSGVVEPLLGLVWFTMFGRAAQKGQFSSFMDSMAKMPSYEKGITWSVEYFVKILAKFAAWIPEEYDMHGCLKRDSMFPELDVIVKDVNDLVKEYRTPDFHLDADTMERIFDLDRRIGRMYNDRDLKDAKFTEARKILTKVSHSLKVILDYATTNAKGQHCKRQKPVGVIFCGASGVGKTYVTMTLVQKLLMRCLPSSLISAADRNYMDFVNFLQFGYNFIPAFKKGYISVVNEFGAMVDVKGQNFTGIVDLLHMVDEAPHVVESASLNDKDSQYFTSKFVIMTTNRTSWKDFESIYFPKALARRFFVFTLFPKKEYCTEKSLKAYTENNNNPWLLCIKDAADMPKDKDGGPLEDCYEFLQTDFYTGELVGPHFDAEGIEEFLVQQHDRNQSVFFNNSKSDKILRSRALKRRMALTGEDFWEVVNRDGLDRANELFPRRPMNEQGFFTDIMEYFYPTRTFAIDSDDSDYEKPVVAAMEELAYVADSWIEDPRVKKAILVIGMLGAMYTAWKFARVHLVEQSFEPKIVQKRVDKKTRKANRAAAMKSTVHVPVQVLEEQMHDFRSNAMNIATKLSSQHIYDLLHLNPLTSKWYVLGRVVFICGRVCLLPKHYVRNFKTIYADGHKLDLALRLSSNVESNIIRFDWTQTEHHDHPHLDWSLVKMPRVIDEKSKILHMFAPRSLDLTEGPVWSAMVRCHSNGFNGIPTQADYTVNEVYGEWDKDKRVFTGPTTMCAEGFHVQVTCDKGDCGFPYLLTDDQFPQPVIFGIHTAGHNGQKHGYAAAVYLEDIKDLLAMFGPMQDHTSDIVREMCIPLPGVEHMMVHGLAEPVHRATKSDIAQAPLHGIFGPPTKLPSRLTRFKNEDGEWVDPMMEAMKSYSKNDGSVNPILYEECAKAQIKHIFKHSSPVPVEPGIISFEEAVVGRPGVFKGIDMSTSCGYGYSNKGITKKDIFFTDGEIDLTKPEVLELKKTVHAMEEKMAERQYVPDIIIDTLKSELLSVEKVREGRSRMFNIYQLHRYILARMYFMPLVNWVIENCMHNGFTLGMNVYADFNIFWRHITSKGPKIISGDVKWFDKKQMIIGFYTFFDFVNAFYIGCNPLEKNVRDMFMCAVMRTLHVQKVWIPNAEGVPVMSDILVEWFGSLTSGWLLTAHAGSFMNGTNLMYCIMDTKLLAVGGAEAYDGSKPIDWEEFFENVSIFKNGDDNIINVSDAWSSEITQSSMMMSSAKIDMYYTPEHKGAITVEHRSFIEIEFLKRMWIFHPKFDYWAGALRKESIIEMLNWTGRVFKLGDYCQSIEHALTEWSAWGPEEFDLRYPVIAEASIRVLNYVPTLDTYEKAFRKYMGTEVQGYY